MFTADTLLKKIALIFGGNHKKKKKKKSSLLVVKVIFCVSWCFWGRCLSFRVLFQIPVCILDLVWEARAKTQLLVFSAVLHHWVLSFEDCKGFSPGFWHLYMWHGLPKSRAVSVCSKINRTESKLKYERKKNQILMERAPDFPRKFIWSTSMLH